MAERIAHLREVKDAPEDERVWRQKSAPISTRRWRTVLGLGTEMGAGRLLLPLSPPDRIQSIAKLLHERRLDREHYIEEFSAICALR